jgi:hypothetical protein
VDEHLAQVASEERVQGDFSYSPLGQEVHVLQWSVPLVSQTPSPKETPRRQVAQGVHTVSLLAVHTPS